MVSLMEGIGENFVFDIAKLKGVDSVSFTKFLLDNGKDIGRRINETAKTYLLKGYVPGHEPAFSEYPDFKEKGYDRWYPLLRRKLCTPCSKGSAVNSILPVAVYLYDCYGISPSKLILGCEAQTTLPAWLCSFMEQVDQLSTFEMNQLNEILERGKTVRSDTVYVLKSRIHEMAAERGIRPDEFFLYPGLMTVDLPIVRSYAETSIKETHNTYADTNVLLGNHKILRMILSMCVIYQVSCEYLLLQDYSDFAVTSQGRYYPPAQRKLISSILRADSETRMKACGFVFAVSAKRVANGWDMPGLVRPGIDDIDKETHDGPVNVMAAATAASGKLTKNAFDTEFADSLKPKLLEILAASSVPVSSVRLFQVVEGPARLVRKALNGLAAEGKVERVPMGRYADSWQLVKSNRGRKPKTKTE